MCTSSCWTKRIKCSTWAFATSSKGLLEATPATRRTHLVSATFPTGIQQLAARYQSDPVAIAGTPLGDANQDIEHEAHLVHPRERYAVLVNLLLLAGDERALVFVERRADALEVAEKLEADGFAALPLSGELAQTQRDRTLAAFRAGRIRVLVATDVAARGLDVNDIATVIHTAPPTDAEVYTHRSGRTGRAGKRGRSTLLAPPFQRRRISRLLSAAGIELQWTPAPDAVRVRTELAARERTKLHASLTASLAAKPSAARRAQAEELVAGRDPTDVVAALLAQLEPKRRTPPKEVGRAAADPGSPTRPGAHTDSKRNGKAKGEKPRRREFERRGRPAPRARFRDGDAVRFFVNWGVNQGATPARLLAAVCRRGQVDGAHIGSIAIHPNASTFDVRADVAERFERLASRRDPRDPQTLIRRDRGPIAPKHRR